MRLLKHLFAPSARRLFPEDALHHITDAIAASEARHTAEICFAVEPALPWRDVLAGRDARDRACEVFSQLRVWDTEGNNGVLLYLLLADHRIEIVADRGYRGRVDDAQWQAICRLVEDGMRAGRSEQAIARGIDALCALACEHFPRREGQVDRDELPNRPHLL